MLSYFRTNWHRDPDLLLLNIKYLWPKSTIQEATTEQLPLIFLVYRISLLHSMINPRFRFLKTVHAFPHSPWNPGFQSSVCGGKRGSSMSMFAFFFRSEEKLQGFPLWALAQPCSSLGTNGKLVSMPCDTDGPLYPCRFCIWRFRTCR